MIEGTILVPPSLPARSSPYKDNKTIKINGIVPAACVRAVRADEESSSASTKRRTMKTHARTRFADSIKETYNKIRGPPKKKGGERQQEGEVEVSKDGLLLLLRVVDHALRALGIVEPIRARCHHPAHAHDAPNWLHGVRLRC
jgi:hypothetical protein